MNRIKNMFSFNNSPRKYILPVFTALALLLLFVPQVYATSLWGRNGFYFNEHKALNKGDIVTIKISENARALHSSSRNNNKNVEISGGTQQTSIFSGRNLLSFLPFFKPQLKTQYQGQNDVSSQGVFTAKISAVIKKILPNGNFLISGEKKLQINNELQVIKIEGEIRPDDIDADNIISSDKIANATVYYKSGYNLSSSTKPGGLMKGISKIVGYIF